MTQVKFQHVLFVVTICVATLMPAPVAADPTSVAVPTHDLEDQILNDVADGELDEFDLMTAAIVLGGEIDPAQIEQNRQQVAKLKEQLVARLATKSNDEIQTAEIVLRFLHTEIMTGTYKPGCCDLREALSHGTFNCIMGTILFQDFSASVGLDSHAVGFSDHVRCEMVVDGLSNKTPLVIETTSIHGVGGSREADEDKGQARRLTSTELLAKVLYNRGLQQFEDGDFEEALRSTELSCQLDPNHKAAAENVTSLINNWSLHLCGLGKFEQAIELLKRGGQSSDDEELFRWNQSHIYARWMQHAEREGDHETIRRIEELGKTSISGRR